MLVLGWAWWHRRVIPVTKDVVIEWVIQMLEDTQKSGFSIPSLPWQHLGEGICERSPENHEDRGLLGLQRKFQASLDNSEILFQS